MLRNAAGCHFLLAMAVICGAAAAPLSAQGTPRGHYATRLVDVDTYRHYMVDVLYAHNGDERMWGPKHDLARDAIAALFRDYGLTVTLHPFQYGSPTYYNVVGERRGRVRPDEIYVVAGHFDTVNCPGADDNASAVACLLEIGRLMKEWDADATIRLISFDREEQVMIGSQAYVRDFGNEKFMGVISLDMIAYAGPDPDKARIRGRDTSGPLKTAVAKAVSDYGGLAVTVEGPLDRTDHAPFEWRGFQGCWLAEYNYIERNPHYHKLTDSVDTPNYIDYEYGAKIVRGTLGWLVEAAGLWPFIRGDVNCDSAIDFGDINAFVLALSDPGEYQQAHPDCSIRSADINRDGEVSFGDINGFVECLMQGSCP